VKNSLNALKTYKLIFKNLKSSDFTIPKYVKKVLDKKVINYINEALELLFFFFLS